MHVLTKGDKFINLVIVLYTGSTGRFRGSFLEELFHLRERNEREMVSTLGRQYSRCFKSFSFSLSLLSMVTVISISILHGMETCERHSACA